MAEEILQYLSPPLAAGVEITEDVTELSARIRCLIVVNTVAFLIYICLAVFDNVSNWELVLHIRANGFSNPLLPPLQTWLYIWYAVVATGTILNVVSIVSDGTSLAKVCCPGTRDSKRSDPEKKKKKRNEVFNMVLWMQEFFMLLIIIFYAWIQYSCSTPEHRDLTSIMIEVGISATAVLLISCWRFIFSILRLCSCIKKKA